MSAPYGGPSWPQEPQPPSPGGPYGQQPPYGQPSGMPPGPPENNPYPPQSGPPYGGPYDPAAGSPYGPPGYPAGAYGAPPPGPPKSRTGLIVGLVIGAVVLLLCTGGGIVTVVAIANADKSASPRFSASRGPDSTPSQSSGGPHKAFSDSCGPARNALTSSGLTIESPSNRDSDIGPTALYFCSGSLTKGSARPGYLGVTAILYDEFAGSSAAERGTRGYESDRKDDETLTNSTVTDVSGVGEKAYMVASTSGGRVIAVKISAVDNNLTVYARISISEMSVEDATKTATDIVKAYISA